MSSTPRLSSPSTANLRKSRKERKTKSSLSSVGDITSDDDLHNSLDSPVPKASPSTENGVKSDDPLAPFNLSEKQRKIFDDFCETEEAKSADPEDPFSREINKLRFVRGYKWNIEDAKYWYGKAMEWRKKNKPWQIKEEEVIESLNKRIVIPLGKNKKGEPAFMMRAAKYDKKTFPVPELAKLIFYLCEQAVESQVMPVQTCVFVVDLKGFGFSNYDSQMKPEIMLPLQEVYPELLGKGFLINTPWLFEGVWKIIKPFLDPVTLAKLSVKGKNFHSELLDAFDPEQIPEEYRNDEVRALIESRNEEFSTMDDDEKESAVEESAVDSDEDVDMDAKDEENEQPTVSTDVEEFSPLLVASGYAKNSLDFWVSRFFVIYPRNLAIYYSKKDFDSKKKSLGMISLSACKVKRGQRTITLSKETDEPLWERYGPLGEKIDASYSAKTFCKIKISSRSPVKKEEWLDVLYQQIEAANATLRVRPNQTKHMIDRYLLGKIAELIDENLQPIQTQQRKLQSMVEPVLKSVKELPEKEEAAEQIVSLLQQLEQNNEQFFTRISRNLLILQISVMSLFILLVYIFLFK